jgi:hypothetical protein
MNWAERHAQPTCESEAQFDDSEARPEPGSMQVVTLRRETVLGPYRLDQFGFDDAHVCLVVDLGLNERNEILEILLGNHGELVGPLGTDVVQRGEIPSMGIDFTGDLHNFNIIAGGIAAHDGQSPGS